VQRLGRLLRVSPYKNVADIYDFIVMPPSTSDDTDRMYNWDRDLVAREVSRAAQFASCAQNGEAALHALYHLRIGFGLLSMSG
jgi:superfamily II DNA or RNA helicase